MQLGPSHLFKLVLFVVLNLADLLLTLYLIEGSGGLAYELNPVAAWWLRIGGWAGLAVFKTATVLLSGGLLLLISVRRPRTGGRALAVGCTVVAGVVLYSTWLAGVSRSEEKQMQAVRASLLRLDQEAARGRSCRATMSWLATDLAAGHCTLAEALERLEARHRIEDLRFLDGLSHLDGKPTREQWLAVLLIRDALDCAEGNAVVMTCRLRAEFRERFGCSVPAFPALR